MVRARLVAVASAAVLAAALVGCASGDDQAGKSLQNCPPAPGVSNDTVRVGLIYPDSGSLRAAFVPVRSGVNARIGIANAAGGIDGRKIELVVRDDGSSASGNRSAAEDLVERSDVLGVIELTAAAAGSADYFAENHVPVVGITAEEVWNDHDNMFAFSYLFAENEPVSTFGKFVKARGGTTAAVLEDGFSESASAKIGDQLVVSLASQGIETVARVGFSSQSSSPARAAADIKASGADVLVATVANSSLASVLAALRQIGGADLKVMISPSGYGRKLLDDYGPAVAGLTVWLNYTPFEAETPAIGTYRDAMSQYSPEMSDPDSELAVVSYISADLFLHGLRVAGPCPTRESFISNLRQVTDYDAGGLVPGPISLRDNRGRPNLCYSFVTVDEAGQSWQVQLPDDGQATQWCGERLPTTQS
ncbi:MAG: ABC transporter substrate-binding protein [Frankia sp.]|nr:ABC transporter substrate-binding protein [Frankia sp.]